MIMTTPDMQPRPTTGGGIRKGDNIMAVASGKGGVGKTWFSITLAHALTKMGKRVLLFDGDLGLANVDVQLGLMPKRDLNDVIRGRLSLDKVIQPYETGVITAIHVQDGQAVKKGDVLIELDPTQNRADHDRALNEYRAAKVEAARLRALIAGRSTFDQPADGDSQSVQLQQQLLRDQLSEYQARVAAAQLLIEQRKAAVAQTRENIRRLEATVPMEAERAEAFKRLMEHDAATKLDFLQAEQQRIDRTQELAGQRKKLVQDAAALSEAETNYRALVSEFQQAKQTELATVETKAASLAQEPGMTAGAAFRSPQFIVLAATGYLLGITASDSPTSITLKLPGGIERTLLRKRTDIRTIRNVSLMPAGLGDALKPGQIANIIAFLRSR